MSALPLYVLAKQCACKDPIWNRIIIESTSQNSETIHEPGINHRVEDYATDAGSSFLTYVNKVTDRGRISAGEVVDGFPSIGLKAYADGSDRGRGADYCCIILVNAVSWPLGP